MDWHVNVLPRVLARTVVDETSPLVNGAHCRIWQGAVNSNGYPVMKFGRINVLVTRYSLAHRVRRFRAREEALHACDTPACIEELHLEHGTKAKNMRQMWARGRRCRPCTFLQ